MPQHRKARVLLVDDAVVARLLVAQAVLGDPDLELAGAAHDGEEALRLLEEVQPDVVVLDVEMPVLDGLQTLRAIRERHRTLPVVMFSTLTAQGQEATVRALSLGADDYVTKPVAHDREASVRALREELLPKLRALTSHITAGR